MRRKVYDTDHDLFAETVREFVAREVAPSYAQWERDGIVDRAIFTRAGKQGLLGIAVPEEYGGAGQPDFRFRMRMMEEMARAWVTAVTAGINTQEDIVIPYLLELGTEEQKRRWLPGLCSGESIGAIAMTEPGTGSDLRAIRTSAKKDGRSWVIDGQKTFISNGINADVVIVFARGQSGGPSLFVVERGMSGFDRGRNLEKIGLHAQDTAELYFAEVRVAEENLLGNEGQGLVHLMERLPRERLSIAAFALAAARSAYEWTTDYCFERRAFGSAIGDFQNSRFVLAEIETELDIAQSYLDDAVLALNEHTFSAVDAAKAKWWMTALQQRVMDKCLQLHGGYGYMTEYPIGRAFVDSRVQSIYGGTNEIMKELIGRDIAKAHA